MADQDFTIRYYYMAIEGLEDQRFVVAKLRRVSSPPVQMGTVSDSMASALGRLADVIRLGKESRNYADLKAVEWMLAPQYMVSAEVEWAGYEKAVCRTLGVERLEPLHPVAARGGTNEGNLPVAFHEATMNDRPYLVARVGSVMGSPAPVFLTWGHERESALARLRDVFRIGPRGQAFRDFVEVARRSGRTEAEIPREWQGWEKAVSPLRDTRG